MNVLIVEDEAHTSQLLKEIIEQDENFLVTEQLETILETVQYLSKYQKNLDLIFLDIHLADGHSFEIFNHIDVNLPVVFCTAYDEYTLQAIKNNGIDYILKPFKELEIHAALHKYKRLAATFQAKIPAPLQFSALPKAPYQQNFLTQYREKTIVKAVKDIALFNIEFELVYLYSFKGEKFPLLKNMEFVESVCDPQQFFRINRQMLLNKAAIVAIEPYFNRKVTVQLNFSFSETPIVSRLKVSAFKEWLER